MSDATNPNPQDILDTAKNLRESTGDFHERVVERMYADAADIATRVVADGESQHIDFDRLLDRVATSRVFGLPLMLLMFAVVLWLTITGANVPSAWLATLILDWGYNALHALFQSFGAPWWLEGFVVDGVYLALGWVISVMLPPMAIFFPLFTLLEDFGYLPRVAFNLDPLFAKAGAHGKQALTMAMGFGCNAAGVIATRIIDSPRERLIAIITNNFSLCNGRWPTQILMGTILAGALAGSAATGLLSATAVVAVAMLGVSLTFVVSWLLSRTLLRGKGSTFSLELPPYRPPRILQTLYTSVIDRTLIVLWRAVVMAAPAGAAIWLLGNVTVGGQSIAAIIVNAINPVGVFLGLNGVILLAYVAAIPANEIVIPTVLMLTVTVAGKTSTPGVMFDPGSVRETASILMGMGGWTLVTIVNLMLFSLVHNPCSTTIMTIYRETRSLKWTSIATLMPVVFGLLITFSVSHLARLFGLG